MVAMERTYTLRPETLTPDQWAQLRMDVAHWNREISPIDVYLCGRGHIVAMVPGEPGDTLLGIPCEEPECGSEYVDTCEVRRDDPRLE
jgi:hypothetical protein